MNKSIDNAKLDYIIEHLQSNETLTSMNFNRWLQEEDNAKLFHEVMLQREAWLNKQLNESFNIDYEYKKFHTLHHTLCKKRHMIHFILQTSVAIVVVVFISIGSIILNKHKRNEKNEITRTSGIELILENDKTIQADKALLQMQIAQGISMEINNSNVTYTKMEKKNPIREMIYHTLRTPAGADYFVRLSDGTNVWLNCGTTLRYPIRFADNIREVYLDGEAFFEVTSSVENPFIVNSHQMAIKVTGTKFNVNAYKTESEISTTLIEGVIKVNNKILRPNEQYVFNRETNVEQLKLVNTDLYVGWIEGMFVFKSQTLESVMNTLARWYQLDVFWGQDRLKEIKFSGNLPRYESVDVVLEIIQNIGKVKLTQNNKTLIIRPK